MFRVVLLVCAASAVRSIIVKDPPPSGNEYKYSYEIEDPTTGDSKSQHEVRQGDVVSGAYTVLDPDGTKRTVEYTADPKSGFKAVVTKTSPQGSPLVKQDAPAHYVAVDNNEYTNYDYQAPSVPAYESYGKSQIPYYHKSYEDDVPVYFTPSNELKSNGISYGPGNYFIPNNEYY